MISASQLGFYLRDNMQNNDIFQNLLLSALVISNKLWIVWELFVSNVLIEKVLTILKLYLEKQN